MAKHTEKTTRILYIYNQLSKGYVVGVKSVAMDFHVSSRTIRRDLEEIRNFCANGICWNQNYNNIVYDNSKKGYYME